MHRFNIFNQYVYTIAYIYSLDRNLWFTPKEDCCFKKPVTVSEDMRKIRSVLRFLLYMNVQTCYLRSIQGRDFIRCLDLDDYFRAELPLLDLSLNSRLLCGAMCTEHIHEWCLSYAWNKDSKLCILFRQRCSNDTKKDQTEKSWEHYEIQGEA